MIIITVFVVVVMIDTRRAARRQAERVERSGAYSYSRQP
jgi:hypothetical protein